MATEENLQVLPIKYEPDPKSDIHTIFTFYKYIEWLLCIKIMDTKNLKEVNMGYKVYVVVYSILVQLALVWCTYIDITIILVGVRSSLMTTSILQYLSVTFNHFSSVIHGAFVVPKTALKMYIRLTKLDKVLHLTDDKRRSSLLKMLIVIHVFYALSRSTQIYYDVVIWPDASMTIAYVVSVTIDFQLLIFFTLTYIIAIRVKVLNSAMMNVEIFKQKTDFDLKEGILAEAWQGEDHIDDRRNMELSHYLAIYNQLADLIDDLNTYFGIPLLFAAITSFCGFLSTINSTVVRIWGYEMDTDAYQMGTIFAWSLYQFIKVVGYTAIAEILQQEIEKTSIIVHKSLLTLDCLDNPTRNEDEIKVLERFCGILSSRDLRINAVNFYVVDFSFLFGLALALVSYTVILTQMI